ncbi:D-alanyl-D-alanine carboxypeptidase [Laceyella sacchari]|uniref:serine hydrolase n=1 Tax=Laceyella sacchari TaxID=37482 RepID=UPI00104A9561|nr:serine hydrolase [Laceyella sacchari]TCW41549.1 D-alanyl-D-alanine carboxypeptidase [Laceyella sacchari]
MLRKVWHLCLTASLLVTVAFANIAQAASPAIKEEDGARQILQFIKKNPHKSSLAVTYNGKDVVKYRSSKLMPLASTVKIIVAVTYAKQAAKGKINPNERIPLTELDKYAIPGLDGGAQAQWLQHLKDNNLIINGKVPLEEVAKGMISFSTNANTEYLMERLSINQINQTLRELGLNKHQPIYPFYSSLLIPYEIWKTDYSGQSIQDAMPKIKKKMRRMSLQEHRRWAEKVFTQLMHDRDQRYIKEADIASWYDIELDRMYSDRFISSTTSEYVSVMKKLNNRSYYPKKTYKHLIPVMEQIMEIPGNKEWLSHAGLKGGSTLYILTQAFYATDRQGNKTELAIFFNNLTPEENSQLQAHLNEFDLRVMTDPQFRKELNMLKP